MARLRPRQPRAAPAGADLTASTDAVEEQQTVTVKSTRDAGEKQTITITFEDGSTAGGVEVCNDCVAAVCGNGVCEASQSICP